MKNAVRVTCLLVILRGALLAAEPRDIPVLKDDARILFQGDSITWWYRKGQPLAPSSTLGTGYCMMIATNLAAMVPERNLEFINSGIDGDRAPRLLARWQRDSLKFKPDVVSILIGINDCTGRTPLATFEQSYEKILSDTKTANPKTVFILCEPFNLGPNVRIHKNIKKYQAAVAKLAKKHDTAFVGLQALFDEACTRSPFRTWARDGIHPTEAGCQLIANEWLRVLSELPE